MSDTGTDTTRPARIEDAAAIAAIYNEAVVSSTATFDLEAITAESRAEWLAAHGELHPVLVVQRAGRVVAWGSLSSVSDRGAWSATVEISTYVESTQLGTGLGTLLGIELIERAQGLGHHVVLSRVCAENIASIHLAEKLGFTRIGVMHEVGRKFGRWLDVVMLEKRL